MAKTTTREAPIRILPLCAKEAENLDIILACDGAASVGQIGHAVAVELTNSHEAARMCCITAVAAESKAHVDIARRARKLILINGCANRCASKVLERLGIRYTYETVIANEGVEKVPTLDFDEKHVKRIAHKIAKEALGVSGSAEGDE
ncbi:MAG: putative zinc-binding protein [Thermodesulfobacteriota bacterium]